MIHSFHSKFTMTFTVHYLVVQYGTRGADASQVKLTAGASLTGFPRPLLRAPHSTPRP